MKQFIMISAHGLLITFVGFSTIESDWVSVIVLPLLRGLGGFSGVKMKDCFQFEYKYNLAKMREVPIFLITVLLVGGCCGQAGDAAGGLGSSLSRNLIESSHIVVFEEQPHEPANPTKEEQHDADSDQDPHHQEANEDGHHYHTPSDPEFWENVLLAAFLTVVGAFCSGMTVGLLSISTMELQMMTMKKNEQQVKMAKMILSVVTDHHLFLVTLLVANAMALESLPLVVHTLMPDWAAILFSTFIVLVVAEIIPQAYCTGQKKIILAYYASPIILVMIKIFWVIVYPMAKGLDYMLGVHHHERIQHKDFATFLNDDKFLKNTEKLLLTSTLQLRSERVETIMTPSSDLFMLEEKQLITQQLAQQIRQRDFSYVLVYKEKRNKVTGVIKVKEFAIKYLKEAKRELRADEIMKPNSNMLTVYSDTNLLEMLMLFQAKSTRIALVCNLKRKIDPKIESIMYSKSDMIFSNTAAKDVEVLGVVFLYQIFDQMTRLKDKIERESSAHVMRSQDIEQEMTTLRQPLINH